VFGKDTKLIYRHYATLYFVFAVDQAESELGILDLIQVFVEVSVTDVTALCPRYTFFAAAISQ
jgi:AP-3 complex subunit sigma